MEEEEENLGAGGFASTPNVGGEGTSVSQPSTGTGKPFAVRPCSFSFWLLVLALPHPLLRRPDSSSVNPEDVDAVIEGIAKAAEADAEKIAAEEAAKDAAEDAAEGPTGEAGKAAAEEAG